MGLDDWRFLISLITLVPESIFQKMYLSLHKIQSFYPPAVANLTNATHCFSVPSPSEDQLWNIQPLTIWQAFLGWESEKWFKRSSISAPKPHLQMTNASLNQPTQ